MAEHDEAQAENEVLEGEAARAYKDQLVRDALGIGLDDFLALAARNALPRHPVVPHLVLLTGAGRVRP